MENTDGRLVLADGVVWREITGEVIVLSLQGGVYYRLDEIGTTMWTTLLEEGAVEPATRRLLDEFDVDEATLTRDLTALVEDLTAAGLLRREDPAS